MKVEGIDSLLRKLESMGVDTVGVIQTQTTKATRFVRDDARLRAPKVTGDLRKSLTPSVKKTEYGAIGTVSTDIEYAAYVEFGTGQMGSETNDYPGISYCQDWKGKEARPYLYPALKENESEIIDYYYKKSLQKLIERIANGGNK